MKRKLVAFMLGLSLTSPLAAKADVNDALLQKLVEKGTITSEEAEEIQSKSPLNGLKIGGVVYFDYSFGQTGGTATDYNQFTLTRAYININKEITPWFKARITPDIYNASGSATATSTVTGGTVGETVKTTVTTPDTGYTVRMKYAYADFLTPDASFLTDNDIRVGLGQLPWLDFAESLNGYRMQSTMFQDKRGLVTSSDAGLSILGNIGGKLSKEQIAEVGNKGYSGKYGSYHIGLYNGGGYSKTTDSNQNKSIQGRFTIRPLPEMLPGLQLTYFGISGKGNTAAEPDWTNNTGLISYQQRYVTASAEYFSGNGNFKGDDENTKSGYSFFGKVVLPMYEKVALFGRYDLLDPNTDASNNNIETTIAGASYRIHADNYLVAAYETTKDHTKTDADKKGQIVLQISF